MLPLRDINPTYRTPYITRLLIAINALVFFWQMSMSDEQLFRTLLEITVVPANISANPFSLEAFLDSVRSMFLHGGIDHILGNMLYLFLFGDNIEDCLGKVLYLVVYFVSGFIAIAAQVMIDPTSPIPLVGASGAIAGVLGGYLILFPAARVRGLIFLGIFATIAELPAILVLGFWFVLQLINGVASLGVAQYGGGVAFFAHIGGFVAGLVMTGVFMLFLPHPSRRQRYDRMYSHAERYRF